MFASSQMNTQTLIIFLYMVYNPKTIDQIHEEAHMEKLQEQRLAAQLPNKDNKQKKGGQGNKHKPK